MAIPAHDGGSAIQTILFVAFRGVAHSKFLLKINSSWVIKKYRMPEVGAVDAAFFH
jgi:hypothetical protein